MCFEVGSTATEVATKERERKRERERERAYFNFHLNRQHPPSQLDTTTMGTLPITSAELSPSLSLTKKIVLYGNSNIF